MTAKDRLNSIYIYYSTNASKIESLVRDNNPKTKFSKQILYNIEKGLTKTISGKLAEILTNIYPNIDFIWLTTGKGEMFNKNDNTINRFQYIILELTQKAGSLKALAEKLSVSPNYISMLISGKRPLTEDLAQTIKKVYEIDVKDLVLEQSLEKLDFSAIHNNIEMLKLENEMLKEQLKQCMRIIDLLEKIISKK